MLDEYRLRFDIEESFLDEKSGGYQIQTSELATRALERLILAIITLHLTSIGGRPCREAELSWIPIGIVAMARASVSVRLASFCTFLR
jgi:hypothetical protein